MERSSNQPQHLAVAGGLRLELLDRLLQKTRSRGAVIEISGTSAVHNTSLPSAVHPTPPRLRPHLQTPSDMARVSTLRRAPLPPTLQAQRPATTAPRCTSHLPTPAPPDCRATTPAHPSATASQLTAAQKACTTHLHLYPRPRPQQPAAHPRPRHNPALASEQLVAAPAERASPSAAQRQAPSLLRHIQSSLHRTAHGQRPGPSSPRSAVMPDPWVTAPFTAWAGPTHGSRIPHDLALKNS